MKVFVSWSGELSCKMAEILKNWIPCIMQSVEVFFSKDDIEKGDNWDRIISTNLSECKYGIICLTPDNINAPWVNFEAGAIAKTLDSKVTALMVGIKPSDIQGPLSRYQATKLEKEDFFQLVLSINGILESPLEDKILKTTFDAIWGSMESEINKIISENKRESIVKKENKNLGQTTSETIEEMLQLLRKQSSMLTNPENILPREYIVSLFRQAEGRNEENVFWDEIWGCIKRTREQMNQFLNAQDVFCDSNVEDVWKSICVYARERGKRRIYMEIDRYLKEIQRYKITGVLPGGNVVVKKESAAKNKISGQDTFFEDLYGFNLDEL